MLKKVKKTKVERAAEAKKEAEETAEYFRQVDAPDGWKFVGEYEKANEKERKRKMGETKTELQRRKMLSSYKWKLAEYANKKIVALDLPEKWEVDCVSTNDGKRIIIHGKSFKSKSGLVFVAKSPKNNVYIKAMRLSRDIDIDVGAIDNMIVEVENTVDAERGLLLDGKDPLTGLRKTEGGILYPKWEIIN